MNRAQLVENSLRDEWVAKGWALVPNFVGPDELSLFRQEAERLWADQSLFGTRGAVPNSATRNDRLDPVIDVSEPFAEFARWPKILELAGSVLAGPAQLMKDKFIAKPPGTGGYSAHQDGAYWQGIGLDLQRLLTATLFLDDATAENGAMECSAGQHHGLLTEAGIIADPDEDSLGSFTMIEAQAGDLLLLHALTPHRSGTNHTAGMRRALHLTFGVDPRPNLYGIYKQARQQRR